LKFRFLRVPLCKGFWNFVKEQFSWLENGFIGFKRWSLVEKSVVIFILGWVFLNKISNLSLALVVQNHYFDQFFSYKFRILKAPSIVCNMMKVFTRQTCASDFFIAFFHVLWLFIGKKHDLGICPWIGLLPRKNTFTSITRVSVAQIEHVWNYLQSLSAGIVLSSRLVVTCARLRFGQSLIFLLL
jgi:hypothetical protein